MLKKSLIIAASGALFSGCTGIPTLSEPAPAPAAPPAFQNSTPDAPGAATALPANWWQVYRDPVLDALIGAALEHNPTIDIAAARLQAARAQLEALDADRSPRVDAGAGASYGRTSENTPAGLAMGRRAVQGTKYAVGINASWEWDVWQRRAHAVEAGAARAAAAQADLAGARLSLSAEVALYYWQCRAAQADLALLETTRDRRAEAENLLTSRFRAGLIGEFDMVRARVELTNAEADIEDARRRSTLAEHALATLTGRALRDFAVTPWTGAEQLPPPPPVAPGLPAELLARRPDLAATSERVRAQLAQRAVAQAAFYPTIALTGDFGFASRSLADLTEGGSRQFNAGPLSLSLPIFDGGRNKANLALAEADYRAAVATHRNTLLVALREVDDALTEIRARQAQMLAQQKSLDSARHAASIAVQRYDKGVASYLDAIDAQRSVLATERGLLQSRAQALYASVQLVRALGGGWAAPSKN